MADIRSYFEKKHFDLFESMSEGVVLSDLSYKVVFVNEAYCRYAKLKRAEIVGRNIYDIRPGSYLTEIYRTKKPIHNVLRGFNNIESYCDYIPIIVDGELIGGFVVVKDVLMVRELSLKLREREEKISSLSTAVSAAYRVQNKFEDLSGVNNSLKKVVELGKKAASSDSYVLLLGESGTGKDLIAQSIHNDSSRRNKPFVDINCATLPEHLLESELFGYIGGAFTGANKEGKMGLFEVADGGTIFLDEIAEMPINLQAKLLRALEERRIRRIGAEKSINVDVRIIAATNQDILNCVKQNKFREDLYYRLAVFVIEIPPLRDRKDDMVEIIERFVMRQENKIGKKITVSKEAMEMLVKHEWPGNVRELRNTIEYATSVAENYIINITDLPQNILRCAIGRIDYKGVSSGVSLECIVGEVERKVIKEYLSMYGTDGAAKQKISDELGISIATLYNKVKKYKL